MRPQLPPQIHVFVRDWLSANNILIKSSAGHVLIDTGYYLHQALTLQLLKSRQGLGDAPLAQLVNTHCHSDHMGGNAAVQEVYGCAIAVPIGEAAFIDPWNPDGLWLTYAEQYAPPFNYDTVIRPGDINVWGDLEWEAVAAPGHDMGALMYWNRAHRILISGDALWEHGFGIVFPPEMNPDCLPAARETLDRIASLEPEVVIPGHGEPFTDVRDALARSYARLEAFEADSTRIARHIVKVMLTFNLLALRELKIDELPGYCARVPVFRELNERYLKLEPGALVSWLVKELTRAGVATSDSGFLRAA